VTCVSCVLAVCACRVCVRVRACVRACVRARSVWSSHTADHEAVAGGDAPTHRWGHSACLMGSSDLVIFGGFDHECNMYDWSPFLQHPTRSCRSDRAIHPSIHPSNLLLLQERLVGSRRSLPCLALTQPQGVSPHARRSFIPAFLHFSGGCNGRRVTGDSTAIPRVPFGAGGPPARR
jgi:hypothetical protein